MNLPRNVVAHTRSWIAGIVVTLATVSPALAASFDTRYIPSRDLLLGALLVLLVLGLAVRLIRNRELSGPAPEGPDLRWWKNPIESSIA